MHSSDNSQVVSTFRASQELLRNSTYKAFSTNSQATFLDFGTANPISVNNQVMRAGPFNIESIHNNVHIWTGY